MAIQKRRFAFFVVVVTGVFGLLIWWGLLNRPALRAFLHPTIQIQNVDEVHTNISESNLQLFNGDDNIQSNPIVVVVLVLHD